MLQSISIKNRIQSLSFFDILKIIIIVTFSFAVFSNVLPYYQAHDSLLYAITAINLANGSYGITNELLTESDGFEFVPWAFSRTIHDTVIPAPQSGFIAITTFSYLVGGYYGLFYQGPILAILFLIVSERVATKLFGSFVGLVTLALLASHFVVLRNATNLMTDPIFSIFVIMGFYFLIKYFRKGHSQLILLSSIFLAGSCFFRYNGILFFPIEVFLIIGYYVIDRFVQNNNDSKKHSLVTRLISKNLKINPLKITIFVLIPWLVFFTFWFSSNAYFFGDPVSQFYENAAADGANNPQRIPDVGRPDLISSILTFDSYRFEWLIFYGHALLADPINFSLQKINPANDSSLNQYLLGGGISFLILSVGLGLSLVLKRRRIEILVLLSFIFGNLLFFSSYYFTYMNMIDRYMFQVYALSFMMFGFVIHSFWRLSLARFFINRPKVFLKIFKIALFIIFILIAVVALFENPRIQNYLESGYDFSNPSEFLERYPLEQLPEKSIVVEHTSIRALEYNAIIFNPNIGNWVLTGELPDIESLNLIQKQKNLISKGYNIFSFKDHISEIGPAYFRYLEKHEGFVLKDYSETFCMMEQIENLILVNGAATSDDVCYYYDGVLVPKN